MFWGKMSKINTNIEGRIVESVKEIGLKASLIFDEIKKACTDFKSLPSGTKIAYLSSLFGAGGLLTFASPDARQAAADLFFHSKASAYVQTIGDILRDIKDSSIAHAAEKGTTGKIFDLNLPTLFSPWHKEDVGKYFIEIEKNRFYFDKGDDFSIKTDKDVFGELDNVVAFGCSKLYEKDLEKRITSYILRGEMAVHDFLGSMRNTIFTECNPSDVFVRENDKICVFGRGLEEKFGGCHDRIENIYLRSTKNKDKMFRKHTEPKVSDSLFVNSDSLIKNGEIYVLFSDKGIGEAFYNKKGETPLFGGIQEKFLYLVNINQKLFAVVSKNDKKGLVDINGNIGLDGKFHDVVSPHLFGGFLDFYDRDKKGRIVKGSYSVFNQNEDIINIDITSRFYGDTVSDATDISVDNDKIFIFEGKRSIALNKDGEVLFGGYHSNIEYLKKSGLFKVFEESKGHAVYTSDNKLLIDFHEDMKYYPDHGTLHIIKRKKGKEALINPKKGKLIGGSYFNRMRVKDIEGTTFFELHDFEEGPYKNKDIVLDAEGNFYCGGPHNYVSIDCFCLGEMDRYGRYPCFGEDVFHYCTIRDSEGHAVVHLNGEFITKYHKDIPGAGEEFEEKIKEIAKHKKETTLQIKD